MNSQKKTVFKKSYDKPFANQQELQKAIGEKFANHGHKVKYKVSLEIKS